MDLSISFSFLLLLSATVYFSVIFWALKGLKSYEGPGENKEYDPVKISVIIPARNEAGTIGKCLADMTSQDYPLNMYEVIVADDASSDGTAGEVMRLKENSPGFSLKLIRSEPGDEKVSSKKKMITKALETASGELVLLTDADTRRGDKWLGSFARYYGKFRPKLIMGPVVYSGEGRFFSRLQWMEFAGLMGITAGSAARGHPLMCNGANLAVERSAFLEAGGYRSNEKIASGDDLFLMMRIREYFGKDAVKFNFSKEALVTTEPENRPAGFLKQRMRWSSKNRYLPDRFVLFVAVITWLMNLFLLSGIVAAFWSLPVLAAVLAVFIVKFFSEYHVVSHIIRLTGKKGRPFLFLIAQLINIPYVILVGLLGTFFSYEWKGRKVTPPVSPVR